MTELLDQGAAAIAAAVLSGPGKRRLRSGLDFMPSKELLG